MSDWGDWDDFDEYIRDDEDAGTDCYGYYVACYGMHWEDGIWHDFRIKTLFRIHAKNAWEKFLKFDETDEEFWEWVFSFLPRRFWKLSVKDLMGPFLNQLEPTGNPFQPDGEWKNFYRVALATIEGKDAVLNSKIYDFSYWQIMITLRRGSKRMLEKKILPHYRRLLREARVRLEKLPLNIEYYQVNFDHMTDHIEFLQKSIEEFKARLEKMEE